MKDDGDEEEDEEETAVIERSNNEEEEEEEEDPFVDNLITQLEDLRNKVRRKRCTKICLTYILSGLKRKHVMQPWKQK